MTRFLNKYMRKFHRWLALPFVALIITLLLTRDTSAGFAVQRAQQILMLVMALSGLHLFVLRCRRARVSARGGRAG